MKKGIAMLLFTVVAFGQKKEVIYKKIADLTCDCSNKKGAISKLTEIDLGLCIFESLRALDQKDQKAIDFNPEKPAENIQNIAEKVGMEMAFKCPSVIFQFKNSDSANPASSSKIETATSFSVQGIVTEIAGADFKSIKMKFDQGEPKEFIWLNPFDGDVLLLKNKVTKGDQVELEYLEEELFDAKSNSYKKFNRIIGIKLK